MTRYLTMMVALLGLAACAQVASEREGTFTYLGKSYRSVERQFDSPNGSYARRYIFIGAQRISCSATDDRDCVTAIQFTLFNPTI